MNTPVATAAHSLQFFAECGYRLHQLGTTLRPQALFYPKYS